jgi:long-chain acyl-CoA synthetase
MISNDLENINSLPEILFRNAKYFPTKKFLFKKIGNSWSGKNYKEINRNVLKIAEAFTQKGIDKNDRIILISSNRVEWVEIDLAIMTIGAITVPTFDNNCVEDNIYIIKNCNPKLIVLENKKILEINKKILKFFPKKKIILIDDHDEFESYGKILSSNKLLKKIPHIKRSDVSTIIYTSGTSDTPKGVILTHDSIIHNLEAALEIFNDLKISNERFISFLPLSHSYERVAGMFFPLLINAEIFFCSSLDKLLSEIKEVKPTIFSAVPRLYENIYKKIKFKIFKTKGFFFRLLKFIIKKNESLTDSSGSKYLNYFILFFIRILFKKKVKDILGGQIKVLISGGAALNPITGNFFNTIGLKLLQGYGQTEASPLISCNFINFNDPQTVGFPVKNTNVKISTDGEIVVKGRNVMKGYWKNKTLSRKTIVNGWLHTGDLGFFDELGRIIINGRKKDLIVTSGGDNVSVQKIEGMLNQFLEIEQVAIYGDNRPYLIALIVVDQNIKKVNIKKLIKLTNEKLNSIEKVRKFIEIKEPFTYENGMQTQTSKLKKKEIFNFYKKKIDELYN